MADDLRAAAERLIELKTWPQFYGEVEAGRKAFEIRLNDRGFAVGDVLWLKEYEPGVGLTGRSCYRRVTYITDWYQMAGYVVMSLAALPATPSPAAPQAQEGERQKIERFRQWVQSQADRCSISDTRHLIQAQANAIRQLVEYLNGDEVLSLYVDGFTPAGTQTPVKEPS